MITVTSIGTDYNELATGQLTMTAEQWLGRSGLTVDDIVACEGNSFIIHAEWGNGEGYDVYQMSFE